MEVLDVASYPDQPRIQALVSAFSKAFDQAPGAVIRVPGRVNLIGEHIDYCGYAVHPMAIEQDVLVATARSETNRLRLKNLDANEYQDFETETSNGITISVGPPEWYKYFLCGVKGVVEMNSSLLKGMECLVDGRIPSRAGLSSSSALVVSAAMCTVWNLQLDLSKTELADICAKSERFIGTQGGGMDQAIEILAQKGTAKLIEFNPLRTHDVKLPGEAVFVIANSLAEANKAAGSEFNTRVAECRVASQVLGKLLQAPGAEHLLKLGDVQSASGTSLPDMVGKVEQLLHDQPYSKQEVCDILDLSTQDDLDQACGFSDLQRQIESFKLKSRAGHVFSEAQRVYDFKAGCDSGSGIDKLGQLMFESHQSCSKMYECSHPQLDQLVALAKANGAVGARLTGAGWGGCIVALVPKPKVDSFIKAIKESYYHQGLGMTSSTNLDSIIFPTQPGAGAAIYMC